jgi:hypothetical protein
MRDEMSINGQRVVWGYTYRKKAAGKMPALPPGMSQSSVKKMDTIPN